MLSEGSHHVAVPALFQFITLLSAECERDQAVFLAEEKLYLFKQVHSNERSKSRDALYFSH